MEFLEIFKVFKSEKSEYLNKIFGSSFCDNNINVLENDFLQKQFQNLYFKSVKFFNNDLN